MVFPVGEVWDEVFSNFSCHVFAGVGIEAFPLCYFFIVDESDGEKNLAIFFDLTLTCLIDFSSNPLALHAVIREDKQEFVIVPDCLLNLIVDFLRAEK